MPKKSTPSSVPADPIEALDALAPKTGSRGEHVHPRDTPLSPSPPEALISMHYPKPTPLEDILTYMAEWSELTFVIDPSLKREVQVFAPRPLSKEHAFRVFTASLDIAGLRAVKLPEQDVIKIVLKPLVKISV